MRSEHTGLPSANSAEWHRGYWDCMKEWESAHWEYGVGYSRNPRIDKRIRQWMEDALNRLEGWD